jgi:predicted ribosomally synthesized peptide with nif11-like leader
MTQEERAAKLKEIFSEKEFVEKVLAMETAEDVQAAVKEKGVELSFDEIEAIRKDIANSVEKGDSEEVSDDELEQVAGGVAITTIVCGLIIGGGVVAGGATLINEAFRRRW